MNYLQAFFNTKRTSFSIYLIFACSVFFLITKIDASSQKFKTINSFLSNNENDNTDQNWVNPVIFSDFSEIAFKDKFVCNFFKRIMNKHNQKKLPKNLKTFFERSISVEAFFDIFCLFILFKTMIHCNSGSFPLNKISSYESIDHIKDSSCTFFCEENFDQQQKISLADIVELFQFLREDLSKIDYLDRDDKDEVMEILNIRNKYLERKLKELGIFRYTPPASTVESLSGLFMLGLSLGIVIFGTAFFIIDFDSESPEFSYPSKTLFYRNLENFSYKNSKKSIN